MNTVQLTGVMDKISCNTYFLGVLPCDYLPKTPLRTLPSMVLINTDPSGLPGQHWLAIYINDDSVACFFDSFGNKPDYQGFHPVIKDFLNINSTKVLHSTVQVQDFSSDTCGQHCVFFLYHMSKGFDYDYVMKLYTYDLIKNDKMVSTFVKKLKHVPCNNNVFKCIQCVQLGEMYMYHA